MGLTKYRQFKDRVLDDGIEILEIIGEEFEPDFKNRHTIQVWDVSASSTPLIKKWKGVTLTKRTQHEITIVNNSNTAKEVRFTLNYTLTDENFIDESKILIGPHGTAYFYCTAILEDNNLVFHMRTGSQDKRNLE